MAIDKLPSGISNHTALTQSNKYKATAEKPTVQQANTQAASKQDAVTLSPQAKRLKQAQQSLANAPVSDNSAKIAALKKAVNEGSYQVDSDRLAANISRFEQDLKGL